ncbi:MAG: hypothetical protein JNG88_00595 [Phycisphaerales bacterium]|nr:hypothetical protein [Phycisphaerales bacterium]
MPIFRIEVASRDGEEGNPALTAVFQRVGLESVSAVHESRLFLIDGDIEINAIHDRVLPLLVDPVTEIAGVAASAAEIPQPASGSVSIEVHLRPGVTDPTAETTLAELRAQDVAAHTIRTARRYVLAGVASAEAAAAAALRCVANDCIEQVFRNTASLPAAPIAPKSVFQVRTVSLTRLGDGELQRLSREGHLFLSLDEMRAIQAHFASLGREPTDLELETLAQTWSEHCVHKTLKSAVVYRGAPMPIGEYRAKQSETAIEINYANLLKDTIASATLRLMAEGRGPECLSVFADNAGIIGFDADYGIAFKVETHNHPSAIEPYGGAATGVGGCIRDVIGCGRGARPIANTDVFCVAPTDWPSDGLPAGALHPRRVLDGVVRGVADYGNRMGIPTVNGAIYFDPRYLANPLVYCGCVGLIPRDKITKCAKAGDVIVVIGGRTGRDGIHGATFSSTELTDSHADEFAHAVQIGNAIVEKRALDAILRARDDASGCLFSAITDCGAGGLSSAIGEMAADVGATVDLEKVTLKYAGLRYDEIWISEAQERMVLAVPKENLEALLAIAREEEVEGTPIGFFGCAEANPTLDVRYQDMVVGRLDMHFLHHGLPKRTAEAEWSPAAPSNAVAAARSEPGEWLGALIARMSRPNIASKERVIRRYDHEVQGGSAIKALGGRGTGPNDAAVIRPRLDSHRGIAIGCGFSPHVSLIDPYLMAVAGIDEAVRNIVCVGGDPARTAILDNFCWGRCDTPRSLGALVRACQACHDIALAYGTPFISGKDSLNNEFALQVNDIDKLVANLHLHARRHPGEPWVDAAAAIEKRIRDTGRLGIPDTLLISAVAIVDDVRRCVSADLKSAGASILLVGGLPLSAFDPAQARNVHSAVSAAMREGLIRACHDVSDGGWLVALAEMAIGGAMGVEIETSANVVEPFAELTAGYVVEAPSNETEMFLIEQRVPFARIGQCRKDPVIALAGNERTLAEVEQAWRTPSGV